MPNPRAASRARQLAAPGRRNLKNQRRENDPGVSAEMLDVLYSNSKGSHLNKCLRRPALAEESVLDCNCLRAGRD